MNYKYCVERMSCIEIIEFDWKYIDDYLKENGGFKIHIYLHYIFESLIILLQKVVKQLKLLKKEMILRKKLIIN